MSLSFFPKNRTNQPDRTNQHRTNQLNTPVYYSFFLYSIIVVILQESIWHTDEKKVSCPSIIYLPLISVTCHSNRVCAIRLSKSIALDTGSHSNGAPPRIMISVKVSVTNCNRFLLLKSNHDHITFSFDKSAKKFAR